MELYICKHCGNIINFEKKLGGVVVCCGEEMKKIIPGETDVAYEKHVPVIKREGNKVIVLVGEIEHPMTEGHFIEWILIETTTGIQKCKLKYTDKPRAEFFINEDDKVINAYAYCNLHSLWKNKGKIN